MIAFLMSLFTWANAPFTMALLVVLLYVAFQVVGLVPWAEHDADAHVDVGGGANADAHVDVDTHADIDAGHGVETEADSPDGGDHDVGSGHAEAEQGQQPGHVSGGSLSVLGMLGFGKVPFSVLWQTFFTMFGVVGVSTTTICAWTTGGIRTGLLAFSAPAALVLGLVLTRLTASAVAKLVPASSGEAASRRQLVGCKGIVISSRISSDFGEIRLLDPAGRTVRIVCSSQQGESDIPEGSEVVVTGWDGEHDQIYVSSVDGLMKGKK